MTQFLYALVAFLVALSILITVHEYGHFIIARLLGVKVLRFSIGFGKPIIRWHDKQQTEYVIAMLPLGGYVKMLDEREGSVPAAELHRAFNRKPLLSRIAVVCAGPLFNLLFAVFAYWCLFVYGMTNVAPIIGKVAPDSIAAKAQLSSRQEIIKISNLDTPNWRAVNLRLVTKIGNKKPLVFVTKNIDSKQQTTHKLDITNWQIDPKRMDLLASLGIQRFIPKIPPIIAQVVKNSPAAKSGIKSGDRIIKVDKQVISDWTQFASYIRVRPKQQLRLQIRRGDSEISTNITPESKQLSSGEMIGVVGVRVNPIESLPNKFLRETRYNPLTAVWYATKKTLHLTQLTFVLFGKMLLGHLSWQTISGPIGIAQTAGQVVRIGLLYFLEFLAIVSISLAVINILPIPMLDGGHLLYYLIEAVRGKPVSDKAQQTGFKIGLFILGLLIVLAFYNDVTRLITTN